MILSRLSLRNFRIHKNINLTFSDTLNYIVGGNGQGKTSVLEAAYYLCTTKSFYAKDIEAVSFSDNDFEVNGFFNDITEDKIRVFFSVQENHKYYFQNEKLISRSSQVIGKFPVVILTPADHAITQGSPAERRKLVDSVISQASSTYLNILLDYNKTLKQRSVVLNRLREGFSKSAVAELDAWTEKLIENGVELINYRNNFIKRFSTYISESYNKIIGNKENPTIQYYFLDGCSEDEIVNTFKSLIEDKRNEEIRRSVNLVGPHRDDFIFTINEINLRTYGSQGQHKTFQTALRFAEFFYLKDASGKTPIFLLDDVFGELDAYRAGKISEYLKEVGQAFITLTDFADFSFLKKDEKDLIIKLDNGNIAYA
ncbi:MAG: DNA replication and repair protein RecF [Ignavibacteriales bacterium]|nr:DNA replication and repair protein RecF [Ignavibacteriales bacterium]